MQGIGGIKAGKAFVVIEAVDATGKILEKVRNRLGKFGTDLTNIGKTMAMRAAVALTPIAFATKAGTAYDDMMRKVQARSEGTADQMDMLKSQTLELGRALGILPSRLASIQNIFAQAGFNRKQIAEITPAVATLARAGGEGTDAAMDADNSAKALTAILRGYNMEASAATDVTDALAVALNASNFNLEDITTSLQYAVPAAAMYNVPMEEMLAILGSMRDLQIDASIAGTAFRNMMGYMSQAKEQEKFNENLKMMTGRTVDFTDAAGNLQSPMKLLVAIMKATEKLGTAERSDILTQLLETRATVPGAAVGRSVERMAEMLDRLAKRKGEAERVRQIMDSGLGGAFRRFMASVEELSIKIQSALSPMLQGLASYIAPIITATTNWIESNRGLFATIIASIAGLGGFGLVLVIVGQSLRLVAGSLLLFTVPLRILPTLLFAATKAAMLLINTAIIPLLSGVLRLAGAMLAVLVPALLRVSIVILSTVVRSLITLASVIVSIVIPAVLRLAVFLGTQFMMIVAEAFAVFGLAWPFMIAAAVAVTVLSIKLLDLNSSSKAAASSVKNVNNALVTTAATGTSVGSILSGVFDPTKVALNDLWLHTKKVASDFYTRWTDTVQNISQSLAAGDIPNAMKTLGLSLQLEWEYAVQGLMDIWDSFILYLKTGFGVSGTGIFEGFMKMENWLAEKMGGQAIFSDEYMQSFRETADNTVIDNEADAKGRMKARRDRSNIGKLEEALESQKATAAISAIQAEHDRTRPPSELTAIYADIKAMLEKILADASGLIGVGQVNGTPKSAIEAIDAFSSEGIKAFIEAQHESQKDETQKKMEDHLAAIRRRVEEGEGLAEA